MYRLRVWSAFGAASLICAASTEFHVPGTNYPAQIRDQISILPGGRALRPFGRQVLTGTGPFAIAVSPSGKTIVTSNVGISTAIGVNRPSISVIVPGKHDTAWNLSDFAAEPKQPRSHAWQGLSTGIALTSDGAAWVSEGDTGRVVELSLSAGTRKFSINLNADSFSHSFTDALTLDVARNLLIVLDQANARAALVDLKRAVVLASAKTGDLPVAQASSADGKVLYVVNAGKVPATLSIIDISNPAAPQAKSEVRLPESPETCSPSWSGASAIAVNGNSIYVSLSHNDAIAVVNARTAEVEGQIELRIPGLETYRGITPLGLVFDPKSKRLLVAEAGINAVGVIDPETRKVLGHLPVGWFPDSIAVHDGQVYVASARGFGTGPSEPAHQVRMVGEGKSQSFETDSSVLRRGSVSSFEVPPDAELAQHTETVLQAAGFSKIGAPPHAKPLPPIKHVVLIAKGDRSFDEVLGDVDHAGDRRVFAEPSYARFGTDGYVSGHRKNFSLRVDVTPNHHEIASRWVFADNYYTDAEYPAAGYQRLTGATPDLRSELSLLYREAANKFPGEVTDGSCLWSHLSRNHIEFRAFDSETPAGAFLSDRQRADQFIAALTHDYLDTAKSLPPFILLNLPGDTTGLDRGEGAYPYEASYIAENDHALGRIVEFLSKSPWWKETAIFITETAADGGADHIDSHRTLLLGAGPWFRTNYVSHTNASAPALLSTIFKLFGIPPMTLY
ncbi:MAG TPA: bifunctional YncE family protein/alkaline phosphatase family protein, partial [Bryobacteraceae bacterium]